MDLAPGEGELCAGPQKFNQYDEEAHDLVRLETKLAALEGDWRAAQDGEGSSSSGYCPVTSSWLSYGTSFIVNIMENRQLNIRDVHLSYEDDMTNPQQISAMGFTLEFLAAQTCDEFWNPKFVLRDPTLGHPQAVNLVPCQRQSHPKVPLPRETNQKQQETAHCGDRPAVGHLAAGV